jgi:Tfp pilus assembly protein PilF
MTANALRQAVALHRAGRLEEAEPLYRAALSAEPGNFDAMHLLGVLRHHRGRPDEAVGLIEAALRLNPRGADAQGNLGNALRALGRLDDAAACYRTALGIAPDLAELHAGFGHVLRTQGLYPQAVRHFRRARLLRPDLPDEAILLCNDLAARGEVETAASLLTEILSREPLFAGAWLNLAILKQRLGDPAASFDCYRRVRAIDPKFPSLDYNEARLHLLTGNYEIGWRQFEARLEVLGIGRLPPGFDQKRWTGEDLGGGTLLVHAEQGFGDTLQFCRYVELAAGRARILLSVPPPLLRLLSGLSGVAEFVRPGQSVPEFDQYCALLSLPGLLGTTLATIPAEIPYLAADRAASAAWHRRLAPLGGVRVGLVWAGGARPNQPELAPVDARRSLALAGLTPLAGIPGATFISLQKGDPAAQAARPPEGMVLHDFTGELEDFADTAALIEALDLVISVDTAVAHLAGAMGKPVWLLNRFDTCWRWLLERDDSPWYPSLRLFRQRRAGDWADVLDRVSAALGAFVAARLGR